MKLIHCSDIHLDIPFGGILPQEKSATRKQEIISSFEQMVEFAINEDVKAVMITGGLIDAEHISRTTIDRVYNAIKNAHGITFILLPGNSYESAFFSVEKYLPDNFRVLSELDKKITIDDVDIYGVYEATKLPLFDDKQLNIVIASGLLNLRGFEERGISYLGLGLERTYRHGELKGGGYFCAPGSLEALAFEEGGNKGFMEIYTAGKRLSPVFVRSGKRLCYEAEVDITGVGDSDAVVENVRRELGGMPGINGAAMVHVNLVGTMDLNHIIDNRTLEKALGREYFAVSVTDEIVFDVDAESLTENSLKDRFIKRVSEGNESLDLKKDIIRAGITAISGGDVF
ncbi:MAG: metallophosphoesterase [Lachnospiraceae bacterium]|nr:metallophosphoesterase [Lachnospiraceae bacterium]MBQ9607080.1 metallophosphoesterase [Lachnospiraceae bacterium]